MSSLRSAVASIFKGKAPTKRPNKKKTPAEEVIADFQARDDASSVTPEQRPSRVQDAEDALKVTQTKEAYVPPVPVPETKPSPSAPQLPSQPPALGSKKELQPELYYWDTHKDTGLTVVENRNFNFYIPNMISIVLLLMQCHSLMSTSDWQRKVDPGYFPTAMYAYLAIVIHLRVLKVKNQHGLLTGSEVVFLIRFEKFCAIDDLPIPLIFRPFFAQLATFTPGDSSLNKVLPHYPSNLGGSPTRDIHDLRATFQTAEPRLTAMNGEHFLMTNLCVPLLLDWMRYVLSADFNKTDILAAATTGGTPTAQVDVLRHEQNGLFVPACMGIDASNATADRTFTLAGTTINRVLGQAGNANSLYLNALGVTDPSMMTIDNAKKIQANWRNKIFFHTGPQLTPTDADLQTMPAYLGMSQTMTWFPDLIANAVTFCKYFGGSVPLGSINMNAKPSAIVFNDVHINRSGPAPHYRRTNTLFYTPMIYQVETRSSVYEEDMYTRDVSLAQGVLTLARITYRVAYVTNTPGDQTWTYLTAAEHARMGPYFNRLFDSASPPNHVTETHTILQSRSDYVHTQHKNPNMALAFFEPRPKA